MGTEVLTHVPGRVPQRSEDCPSTGHTLRSCGEACTTRGITSTLAGDVNEHGGITSALAIEEGTRIKV